MEAKTAVKELRGFSIDKSLYKFYSNGAMIASSGQYKAAIRQSKQPGDRTQGRIGLCAGNLKENRAFLCQNWKKIKEMLIFKSCLLWPKMLY